MAHIGVRMPADEKEQLMAIARESNTTLSHLIRQMIKAMMGDESSSPVAVASGDRQPHQQKG